MSAVLNLRISDQLVEDISLIQKRLRLCNRSAAIRLAIHEFAERMKAEDFKLAIGAAKAYRKNPDLRFATDAAVWGEEPRSGVKQ